MKASYPAFKNVKMNMKPTFWRYSTHVMKAMVDNVQGKKSKESCKSAKTELRNDDDVNLSSRRTNFLTSGTDKVGIWC